MKPISTLFIGLLFSAFLLYPAKSNAQSCKRPNVILIICDDMRYDSFDLTGGPDYLNTPSIDRIANEGARFDNFYCTYSLCIPSRASIMTGLYPHSHGAVDNCNTISPGITTLAEVLDDAGYNTAMIGKYHVEEKWQPGWDYWLATKGKIDYKDPSFYYFNTSKTITGNIEQIIYDTVHKYLSAIDTPFFINVGHLAPHRVCVPMPQFKNVLSNDPMPVPSNFYPYTKWYPSFLYDDSTKLYLDEDELTDDYEGYFEGILGIEYNTTDILNILTQRGLLDNTMIIFMSDNGAIFGEHLLKGKGEAYEPSIHLPLFIRYPKWFAANTVVNNDFFALNIDIMPTILDACCLSAAPYNVEGSSLTDLLSGAVQRPTMMYETVKLASGSCMEVQEADKPSIRAVRSKNYKYISYHCDNVTEEFFDLQHDPMETVNQIHNPDYASKVEVLKENLLELQVQYFDTLSSDTAHRDCWLIKVEPGSLDYTVVDNPFFLRVDPNPASENVNLSMNGNGPVSIWMTNLLGEVLYHNETTLSEDGSSQQIDISQFPPGIYFLKMVAGDVTDVKTLIKN
jgi:N-acetylglucosamine-6-sulfatase